MPLWIRPEAAGGAHVSQVWIGLGQPMGCVAAPCFAGIECVETTPPPLMGNVALVSSTTYASVLRHQALKLGCHHPILYSLYTALNRAENHTT